MALGKFTDFLNRVLYVDGSAETTETPAEAELTQEEMAAFESLVSEENTEDVIQMSQKIIADSQIEYDDDEYPDISNVQTVLDTAGVDADHELIRKILKNFVHCDPDGLEKDGINRKQAILDAIEQIKQKDVALKSEKANDEQNLLQEERDAEKACTEAISRANAESEKAIEEEKARSAAIIAEIRSRTDEAAESAKQERDATLQSIAEKRTENEAALRKSANLVAETEKQGQVVIDQIDAWLTYLQ